MFVYIYTRTSPWTTTKEKLAQGGFAINEHGGSQRGAYKPQLAPHWPLLEPAHVLLAHALCLHTHSHSVTTKRAKVALGAIES